MANTTRRSTVGLAAKGGRWCLAFKGPKGWTSVSTGLDATEENRPEAENKQRALQQELDRHQAPPLPAKPKLTVEQWAKEWVARRAAKRGERQAKLDYQRLRDYVFAVAQDFPGSKAQRWPVPLGKLLLDEVKPRHMLAAIEANKGRIAPRTIRHTYFTARALFRDAFNAEEMAANNPCQLAPGDMPENKDSAGFKRKAAVFSRVELMELVGDPAIDLAWRVAIALLGIGMLRTGEMDGLRWGKVELNGEHILGRLFVETHRDSGETKTGANREMPIHPVLGKLLAEWKLGGWAKHFGRAPKDGDLVLPVLPEPARRGPKLQAGTTRPQDYDYRRITALVEQRGWRHRRVHDLRRTGISIARSDGAAKDILSWGTHAPPASEAIDLYTSFDFDALCREVLKMKLQPVAPATGTVAQIGG